jgi:hypothetical protein
MGLVWEARGPCPPAAAMVVDGGVRGCFPRVQ